VPPEAERLAAQALEAAFRVHRKLGPGLLESVYEACFCHELSKLSIPFEHQVDLPVDYDGIRLASGLRLDVWLDRRVIIELKAVENVSVLHRAQLLTYMKLTGCRLGFIINFNVPLLKNGIIRMVL
jgi:GxxExxY protein